MKQSTKASVLMRRLLIEKRIDGFSVIEARDAFLSISEITIDPIEARKKVYRQILRFENNGWLQSEGSGRNKKYFQTESFKAEHYLIESNQAHDTVTRLSISDYSVLEIERNEYAGELEITLNEIEECQSLISRFPHLINELTPFLQKSKERSATLLGKLNVLTHIIKVLSKESCSC